TRTPAALVEAGTRATRIPHLLVRRSGAPGEMWKGWLANERHRTGPERCRLSGRVRIGPRSEWRQGRRGRPRTIECPPATGTPDRGTPPGHGNLMSGRRL